MAWLILVLSGVLEAVWAIALGRSDGFSRLGPTVLFGTALVVSMAGLAYAMRSLPTGTSYAVWVGIGAALTVAYGMVSGTEPASVARVVFILGIVGCVVGLQLIS
ncbi:multidrug efflux SMR transporter [Gordonia defluvii]|uniref:Multidrug efflux SMR transporter n=1 Tax=Gordonia defluvii TaxID=283718 RepID=A0ABP6L420_9ACTN|nr:SMR family transporter [Gordonia sp. UBA5067]